jgi:hypothetical protein
VCSVDGCERPVRARGLCSTDYKRIKRLVDGLAKTCVKDGCDNPALGRHRACNEHQGVCRMRGCQIPTLRAGVTVCRTHYNKSKRSGRADQPKGLDCRKVGCDSVAVGVTQRCREHRGECIEWGCPKRVHRREGRRYSRCKSHALERARSQSKRMSELPTEVREQIQAWQREYHSRPEVRKRKHRYSKEAIAVGVSRSRAMALRKYGLSLDEYLALGTSCWACGATQEELGRSLHIDHDHSCCPDKGSCGACVRGLLCASCNQAEGLLKGDPERALGLAIYLEAYATRPPKR